MKEAKPDQFSAEEREVMKARADELKRAKKGSKKADLEQDLLNAIQAMPEPDRSTSTRLHALIKAAAPELQPKTWYGMPAYANDDGKVVLFFRGAAQFKERYMTLGFNQEATLDSGNMWPIAFALTQLTPTEEAIITKTVRQALSKQN